MSALTLVLALLAAVSPAAAQSSAATYADIGDYHVILWTSVLLVGTLATVVYFMLDMGSAPLDSSLRSSLAPERSKGGGDKSH